MQFKIQSFSLSVFWVSGCKWIVISLTQNLKIELWSVSEFLINLYTYRIGINRLSFKQELNFSFWVALGAHSFSVHGNMTGYFDQFSALFFSAQIRHDHTFIITAGQFSDNPAGLVHWSSGYPLILSPSSWTWQQPPQNPFSGNVIFHPLTLTLGVLIVCGWNDCSRAVWFSVTSDSNQFGMKSLDLCCSLQSIKRQLNFSMTIWAVCGFRAL